MAAKKKKTTIKKAATKKQTTTRPKSIETVAEIPSRQISDEAEKNLQLHHMLKLQIELVPRSCWLSNVRSHVTREQWDNIRKPVYQKANNMCEICGEKGTEHPVECHEVWSYDDTTLIQKLEFFQALCPPCHEVKHIGLAEIKGNGERAFNRFKTINKLDSIQAKDIKSAVFKQWFIRSRQQWKLDIEHLKQYGLNPKELEDTQERG